MARAAPEEALTLVFLHEGLGCADMWRDFPGELAAATGCGALVFSRLGYGGSDACALPRPLRFMHHEGLGVLPELLEKAGIEDCILVGHSDGGSIGIIYAGGTKALPLRGVITEAAHVFCEDLSIESIQAARERYLEGHLRERLKNTMAPTLIAPSGDGTTPGCIPILNNGTWRNIYQESACLFWPSRGRTTRTERRPRSKPSCARPAGRPSPDAGRLRTCPPQGPP